MSDTSQPDREPPQAQPIVRDYLALDRTQLANERTLLAYTRTALAFVAAGLGLVIFLPWGVIAILGWSFVPLGLVVMVQGLRSYARVSRRIRMMLPPREPPDAASGHPPRNPPSS